MKSVFFFDRRFLSIGILIVILCHKTHAMDQVQQPTPMSGFVSGADTVSAPEEKIGTQGNWVKKKDWVIKINETNAEIQDLAVAISGYKKTFNDKFYTSDTMLEAFYKDLGQQQGKIAELFDSVIRYLDKKKKKDIAQLTTPTESSEPGQNRERLIKIEVIEQKINGLKNDLEQFKLDMKSIEELGTSMNDRMNKVDEAIKSAIDTAAEVQTSTDEAWQIIDDKKVRLKYYEIRGNALEKLKTIEGYLRDDLSNDFDVVIDTIKTQIDKVQTTIKQLEEKGLFIKDRAHRVEEVKGKELKEFKDKQQAEEEELRKLAGVKRKEAAKPWYLRWYNAFIRLIGRSVNFVSSFFGSNTPVKNIQQTKPLQADPTPPRPTFPSSSNQPQGQQPPLAPQQIPAMPARNPVPTMPLQ